jgi:hypothetical protein
VNEDVNDALTVIAEAIPSLVVRMKDMVRRFGFPILYSAVEKARYPGLDLSSLRWTPNQARSDGAP